MRYIFQNTYRKMTIEFWLISTKCTASGMWAILCEHWFHLLFTGVKITGTDECKRICCVWKQRSKQGLSPTPNISHWFQEIQNEVYHKISFISVCLNIIEISVLLEKWKIFSNSLASLTSVIFGEILKLCLWDIWCFEQIITCLALDNINNI